MKEKHARRILPYLEQAPCPWGGRGWVGRTRACHACSLTRHLVENKLEELCGAVDGPQGLGSLPSPI